MKYPLRSLALLALLFPLSQACRKDPDIQNRYGNFPTEIGEILVKNCAQSGCHTDQSYAAEGRLSLESWESLFRGSRAGATVIPYRPEQSFLMYFVNTDTAAGIVQEPTMPLNQTPLTQEQVTRLRDWITAGAPDIHGKVKFADNPSRSKVYITNQGCDNVTVIDRESRLAMRYVDVGAVPGFTESPHNVKVSPDGKYWYVVFLAGSVVQRYNTADDKLSGEWTIGSSDWNTFNVSPDGRYGFAVAYAGQKVGVCDLSQPGRVTVFQLPSRIHGACVHPTLNRIYVTAQDGSELYKLDYTDPFDAGSISMEVVDLTTWLPPANGALNLKPHEVAFTPEGDVYAVTCQGSAELRLFRASDDSLLASIGTGDDPVEMGFSPRHGYLFVACMEDQTTWGASSPQRGSIAVIHYRTRSLVSTLYTGYQPHGIQVDDALDLCWVANRNVNPSGPAPHHTSACGSRNGYLSLIDMSALTVLPYKAELAADPYSLAIRF